MFALIDCNNFYASCERVFNPKLKNKALVVLSNNDGCVIARSNEAKALNIKMGDPIFLYKKLIKEEKIEVFSSNFPLYGDMSNRVMQTLKTFGLEIEIYSIDEAFLKLNKNADFYSLGREIKEKVYRWTGLPVSIGIGPTKTLAKLASCAAKKKKGVFILESIDRDLENISIEDIWQIGPSSASKLKSLNILNAKDLKNAPDELIKKHLKTPGYRTVLELRGVSCSFLQEENERKSILVSRSFTKPLSSFEELYEALSSFVALGSEKLRKEKKLTIYLTVFIKTNRFSKDFYENSYTITLPEGSNYTPILLKAAKNALLQIYVKNLLYKRAGIYFSNLISKANFQPDLFSEGNSEKREKAMKTLDEINRHYAKKTLFFASEGIEKNWTQAQTKRSPKYTTSWEDLLKV